MKVRAAIFFLSVAALCGCNNSNQAANKSNSSSANTSTSSANSASPAAGADPTLPRDVTMAAELIKGQLPIRQANGVTVTGVEANGTELILEMQVPQDLDDADFEKMEEQLPVIACGNPQAQQMFSRGGTYTYRVTDSGGEQFVASVNRCTPAGS